MRRFFYCLCFFYNEQKSTASVMQATLGALKMFPTSDYMHRAYLGQSFCDGPARCLRDVRGLRAMLFGVAVV